jgi:hypothetical protein
MLPRRQTSDTCCQAIWTLLRIEEGWLRGNAIKAIVLRDKKWTEPNAHYALWKLVREGLIVAIPTTDHSWMYALAPIAYRPLPPATIKAHMQQGKRADRRERHVAAR